MNAKEKKTPLNLFKTDIHSDDFVRLVDCSACFRNQSGFHNSFENEAETKVDEHTHSHMKTTRH